MINSINSLHKRVSEAVAHYWKTRQIQSKQQEISGKADQGATETSHRLIQGDARNTSYLQDNSIHLVVTSPPYWTLKKYNVHQKQMGHIEDYDIFLEELSKVWKGVFRQDM